jgi:hypothetical protein
MWRCPRCNENIEDQFDSCWKCTGTELREPPPNDSVLVWLYPAVSLISLFGTYSLAEFFWPSPYHDGWYFAFGRAICGFIGGAICIWMFFRCPLRHWFVKLLTLLLLIPAIGFGLKTISSFVSEAYAEHQGDGYPRSRAFRMVLQQQTNAAANLQTEGHLLRMTCYYKPESPVCLRYFVKTNGVARNHRYIWSYATQDSHWSQLDSSQLAGLRSAIDELPTNSVTPPYHRLLIVSYRDGTNWVTRTYDRSAFPPAIGKIYDIIGERFETKTERE